MCICEHDDDDVDDDEYDKACNFKNFNNKKICDVRLLGGSYEHKNYIK